MPFKLNRSSTTKISHVSNHQSVSLLLLTLAVESTSPRTRKASYGLIAGGVSSLRRPYLTLAEIMPPQQCRRQYSIAHSHRDEEHQVQACAADRTRSTASLRTITGSKMMQLDRNGRPVASRPPTSKVLEKCGHAGRRSCLGSTGTARPRKAK